MVDHALNHDGHASLADRFEEHRPRLRAVAYRLLGSFGKADDAVQEAELRLSRSGPEHSDEDIVDPAGRPTAAVAQVCLDMLRSRESRREDPWDPWGAGEPGQGTDPEERALLGVLDALTPAERVAFVLHDMFEVSFEEIAPIVERTPAAARQLAARARRRVQGTEEMPEPDLAHQREVVAAVLAASRSGEVDALLALLDPDAMLRADSEAIRSGATTAHGAQAVAEGLADRARSARVALVDGAAGLVWAPAGTPRSVLTFTVLDAHITAVDILMDPGHLDRLNVEFLPE
ncbi:sigma factor-like helix-turn-helix DNA-binding protein [Streptomyces sp. NBC_01353]|uniref:sigma factor-like helix-turn-helix DNA-binding protein n=1 Tax=Streptomyces sp. NBC_01353 TaxID=2903835 RepID=UPI002E363A7E|nr:sigma factor-like helix-turn-helix DNA-binding protein [Streptomyces sp. NBC_01353]